MHDLLGRMHELAMILRERRFDRGALELTMPEVKIDLDKDGRVTGAHLAKNTESHQIIEEFMLAANEAVAETLDDAGPDLPAPRPRQPRSAEAEAAHRVRPRAGLRGRQPGEPLRAAEAAGRGRRATRESTRSTTPCCARCSGPSTAPRTKGTTPWPAIATATSPRRFAAIPTSRSIG